MLCIIVFVLRSTTLLGQYVPLVKYAMEDGLPSKFIYRTIQDYQGNLWVCTPEGISKFDGYEFKNFTVKDGLPDNDVFNLIEDYQHRLWIINNDNVLAYIKDDKIKQFDIKSKGRASVVDIHRDHVKIFNYDGLFKINSIDSIQSIEETNFNLGRHLTALKNTFGRKEIFGFSDKIIIPNSKNRTLIKSISKCDSLLRISPYQTYVQRNAAIHIDIYSNQLQHSSNNKIITFDSLIQIVNSYSLPIDTLLGINSSFQDRMGNFWISTKNGLLHLNKSFTNSSLLRDLPTKSQEILNLETVNSGLLYSNSDNEIHLRSNTSDNLLFPFSDKYLGRTIVELQLKKQVVYFSFNDSNIFQLQPNQRNPSKWEVIQTNNIHYQDEGKLTNIGNIKKVQFDKEENIFLITSRGLFKNLDLTEPFSKISSDYFLDFKIKFGRSLLLNKSGIYELRNNEVESVIEEINNPYRLEIIDSLNFIVFTEDEKSYLSNFENFKEIDCLANFKMKKMIRNEESLWFLHKGGLIQTTFDSTFSIECERKFDLLVPMGVNQIHDFIIKDSIITLATDEGLFYLNKNLWSDNSYFLPFHLNSLVTKDSTYQSSKKLELKYDQNTIEIPIKGISLLKNHKVTYHYRLLGVEDDFLQTNATQIRYPELKPGQYTFEAYATDSKNISSELKSISFCIKKPWWQQAWFLILFFCSIVCVIYYFVKRRLNKIEEKSIITQRFAELELNALQSQMNPHFVFNAMGSLQSLVQHGQNELADHYIAKFAQLMRMFLDASNHKFISIEQELNIVKTYFDLEKLRFSDKIKLVVNNDLNLLDLQKSIPASILQPFVENAINHGLFHKSGQGVIHLNLTKRQDDIHIEIIDDGIGRELAQDLKNKRSSQHKSRALAILSDKITVIEKLDGTNISYEIIDLYEKQIASGTKVIIIIKSN